MKLLMVCHGNICRSPLAKAIMIVKLKEAGVLDTEVDSAGTAGHHAGEPPDTRTIANAASHGINLASYRARQFQASDFDKFDRIYVMDSANFSDLALLAENDSRMLKVQLFLEAAHPGKHASVPDPWYGTKSGFEEVYMIIEKGCAAIVKQLKEERRGGN